MKNEIEKTKLPLVTVIIPVYKVEKYLSASVESVLNQNYDNINVILVDDGSPDSCPEMCDDFAEKYQNISVIHKENGGLSSARNKGLDFLDPKTKYILFLDSDDILQEDAIAGLVLKAEDTGADVVMPDRYVKVPENGKNQSMAMHFPESCYITDPKKFAMNVMMENGRAWRATCLLYSKSVIDKSGARFPIGKTAEDITFNFSIMKFANQISFYPYSTMYYLRRTGSISQSFQPEFEKTINYIDLQARSFLSDIGKAEDKSCQRKADALYFRNMVVYLYSVMKTRTLSLNEKKRIAEKLCDELLIRTDGGYQVPYFDGKMKQLAMWMLYRLLDHNWVKLTIGILSVTSKI